MDHEKEVCEMFIKIRAKNYFVENLEIRPDSETLTVVIPQNQWPWVSIQSIRSLKAKIPSTEDPFEKWDLRGELSLQQQKNRQIYL